MAVRGSPLGGQTTSAFQAQKAQLDFELAQRRAELLRGTGQMGPGNQWIPGDVEREAGRNIFDLERQRGLTTEAVVNAMREGGTIFSGVRARETARGEHPFIQSIARIRSDSARSLQLLYQQLADLQREREVQYGLMMAEAAQQRMNYLGANRG
jgi:hypothetical protein